MILRCYRFDCKSKYQDERYGVGKRVHNKMKNLVENRDGARCTVCRNTRVRT